MLVLNVIQYFISKFIKWFLPLTKNLYINTCTCSLQTKTQIPSMRNRSWEVKGTNRKLVLTQSSRQRARSRTTITRNTRCSPKPHRRVARWNQRRLLYAPAFILKNQNSWRHKGKQSRGNEAEAQKKTRRWIVNPDKCPGFRARRHSGGQHGFHTRTCSQ